MVRFELTQCGDPAAGWPAICGPIVIFDNAIGFNDFRGTEEQIALSPEDLDEYNDISRNLGNNRGHGAHPSAFGPNGD